MLARWGVAAAFGALFVLGTEGSALARDRDFDFDFEFSMMAAGAWLREMPDLRSDAVSLESRRIADGTLRSRGGLGMYGFGSAASLTVDDRWMVPLAGFNAWWAIGSYDKVSSSFDGSIAQIEPWTSYRFDFLLPGFGRRIKLRRNMVSFAIRSGVSRMRMDGTVASGAATEDLELTRWTLLVQAEVEGCRRLDPTQRVCIQIAPRIYEHSFLNGLTVGLRWEWGR